MGVVHDLVNWLAHGIPIRLPRPVFLWLIGVREEERVRWLLERGMKRELRETALWLGDFGVNVKARRAWKRGLEMVGR